jgi:hypothetical protein
MVKAGVGATATAGYELRICQNKVCVRQGSRLILQFTKDLALPNITVNECGCLGSCGSGPNLAVIPLPNRTASPPSGATPSMPLLLHHVATPSTMSDVLKEVCGAAIDDTVLRATELRLAGNAAATDNDFPLALNLYAQALALNPAHGRHLLLSNRSAARLASGDADGALEDATAASECCPDDFSTAAVRRADALFALERFEASLEALQRGAERHPPWKRTREYRELEGAIAKAASKIQSKAKARRW